MNIVTTDLPGVLLLEPKVWQDSRGHFFETYRRDALEAVGVDADYVQDNQSHSSRGTLRGLHYQLNFPQAKSCRVVQGAVLDVAVDIRRGSPTFGQWASAILSEDNRLQMLVPVGFAHGFLVLSETATFLYKCTDFYHPEDQYVVAWDDPELGIDWGLPQPAIPTPVLSPKDLTAPRLADIPAELLPRL